MSDVMQSHWPECAAIIAAFIFGLTMRSFFKFFGRIWEVNKETRLALIHAREIKILYERSMEQVHKVKTITDDLSRDAWKINNIHAIVSKQEHHERVMVELRGSIEKIRRGELL